MGQCCYTRPALHGAGAVNHQAPAKRCSVSGKGKSQHSHLLSGACAEEMCGTWCRQCWAHCSPAPRLQSWAEFFVSAAWACWARAAAVLTACIVGLKHVYAVWCSLTRLSICVSLRLLLPSGCCLGHAQLCVPTGCWGTAAGPGQLS